LFPTLFEEIYYGSDELRRRHGARPRYVESKWIHTAREGDGGRGVSPEIW